MNKICHISSVHPRYDIRIFIKECISLSNYYMVDLIIADGLGDEYKNGVNIYDVGIDKRRLSRIVFTPQRIFAKLKELKPKIVHFHDPELIPLALKLNKLGYQVIYDVHEDLPKQILNKVWLPKLLRPLIAKFMTRVEKFSASKFAGIVAATDIIANRFIKYNSNTITIHNYPQLSEFASINNDWGKRRDSICYVGSISKARGIIPLIDSLTISRLKLELAGIYSDEDIRFIIEHRDGYQYVNYHGILSREQITQLLASTKIGIVTLLPTPSYVESLPIKLFEYMAAGIPVVVSNFPLWHTIINESNCGILVNPENPQEIAKACEWLMMNHIEAQQMGENGRAAVLQNYTWEAEQTKLMILYSQLSAHRLNS